MILAYIIIGFIWIFITAVVLSTVMFSSRFNSQFEDMEEQALVLNARGLEFHKPITVPSSRVMATLKVKND